MREDIEKAIQALYRCAEENNGIPVLWFDSPWSAMVGLAAAHLTSISGREAARAFVRKALDASEGNPGLLEDIGRSVDAFARFTAEERYTSDVLGEAIARAENEMKAEGFRISEFAGEDLAPKDRLLMNALEDGLEADHGEWTHDERMALGCMTGAVSHGLQTAWQDFGRMERVAKMEGRQPRSWSWPSLKTLSSHLGLFWTFMGVAAAFEKPVYVGWDEEGRLHAEGRLAVEFPDGWGLAYHHGVRVPRKAVVETRKLTVGDIHAEPNVEVKRAMIEIYGFRRFMRDTGTSVTDVCPEDHAITGMRGARLYHFREDRLAYLRVRNSTREPDGRIKAYYLPVPPRMRTAAQAVAWTFGMTEEEYRPMVET